MYGNNVVCVFQEGSVDSFTGAWVLSKRYPGAMFTSTVETLQPSDIRGKDVYVMGAVTILSNLIAMSKFANSIIVFQYEDTFLDEVLAHHYEIPENLLIHFDAEKSIATASWSFFDMGELRPSLFDYLEDRTLWIGQYPETREVIAGLLGYKFDFTIWDYLINNVTIGTLINEGALHLRRLRKELNDAVRASKRRLTIAGYNVPVIQISPVVASEVCLELSKGEPFAACYWDTPECRVFDLISTSGIDVSQIVSSMGGHGTFNEAWLRVPFGHELAVA